MHCVTRVVQPGGASAHMRPHAPGT